MVAKTKRPVPNVTVHKVRKNHQQQPPCAKLSTVRRNLFGNNEKGQQQLDQLLDRHASEMAKKSARVWNFDFARELPLQGRYVWQRVEKGPDFYAWSRDEQTETKSGKDPEQPSEKQKPRFLQASIKDFARVRKRRLSSRLRLKQLHRGKLRSHLLTSSAAL